MENVAIIGIGRMGSLIAKKLYSYYHMILIDKNLRQCGLLAKELGGMATSEFSILPIVNYVIIALPAGIIPEVVREIKPFLKPEHIIINISTDTEKAVFEPLKGLCKLATAKIIGHARQIGAGELPLIVVDADDPNTRNKTANIFANVGAVCFGNENLVRKINNVASEEGIKAALNIEKKLESMGIPSEYFSFAIRNVACGTMNAYVLGDAGHFVEKIIKKLKKIN